MKSLPASLQAKLRKQNGRRSAILCQHSQLAACRLHVGRGRFCPSPARAPGGWKASQRHGALISHWEVLPVPGKFWHRRTGLRLYKGWKQCLLLKERLCCFMVSSSLLPLLHFIQCSLINQISSSKLRSLSSYSPRQALCLPVLKAETWPCLGIFALQMLRNLGGGHPLGLSAGGLIGWLPRAAPSPANWRTVVGHLSLPKMSLKAGLEMPFFCQLGGSCCEETH